MAFGLGRKWAGHHLVGGSRHTQIVMNLGILRNPQKKSIQLFETLNLSVRM
jgi:hypothetical protein